MNKLGKYSESFLEDYKENIQKAWIRERESFFAQQKKLRKEVDKLADKKA
jgi:hypothetical protein